MPNSLMQNWEIAKNLWNTFGNNPDNQKTVDSMKGMLGLLPAGAGDVASGLLAADDVRRGDYGSAALNGIGVLPFIPSMAGMVKGKGDDIAKAIKPTKYEQAHEVARKNAVKMLGLPENNTAMDRAKALGYTTPAYHGTNADILAMNVEGKGKTSGAGAFFTDNPLVAETYVSASGGGNIMPLMIKKDNLLEVNARGRNWADLWTNQLSPKAGKKRLSLDDLELDKNSATTTDEISMIAGSLGLNGADIKNVKDLGPNSHVFRAKEYLLDKYGIVPDETWSNVSGNQFAEARDYMDKLYKSQKSNITSLQDPSLVRSRFAAFDPARINEPDLLGRVNPELLPWLTGAGLLGAGGMYYSE